MIQSKIIQTVHGLISAEYEMTSDSGLSGKAIIKYNGIGTTIHYDLGGRKYELRYDQGAGLRYYYIYDELGRCIGSMEKIRKNKGIFSPVFYCTEVSMNGKRYNIYNVGMGKEGAYYPCYRQNGKEDGEQTAMLHKEAVVQDLHDTYDCYVKYPEEEDMMLLFSVYNDFWNFRRTGKVEKNHKRTELFYSMNKQERAKYNPDFLKNI